MDDLKLLRDFATNHSESAFATVVGRYVNLVWSAAHRQVRDAALAEEISSAVFCVLARKAGSLPEGTVLAGWLLRTTRFVAVNALRREARRRQREEEAMNILLHQTTPEVAWQHISPLLDEGLAELGERDRDALALRFFEQRSFREVGQALGTTEDSAQKRVARAVERLRRFFERNGVGVPGTALAALLAERAVRAAPASVAASAGAAAGAVFITGATLPLLARGVLDTLTWLRWRALAWQGAAVSGTLAALVWLGGSLGRPKEATDPKQTALQAVRPRPVSNPVPAAALAAKRRIIDPAQALTLRVLDSASEAPLGNVAVTLVEVLEFSRRQTNEFSTDRSGLVLLPKPQGAPTNWNYRLEVARDGYVSKFISWSHAQGDAQADFPRAHTTRLERGTEIGGLVTGPLNEPVAGALVIFNVNSTSPFDAKERERLTWMGSYHTELTDIHGRWHCNHVPTNFGRIYYRLVHPDYQETTYYTEAPENSVLRKPSIPKADFAQQRAVMVMRPGIMVAGQVMNDAGRPLAGAKVTQDHFFAKRGANVLTDGNGRFQFRNAVLGKLTLTVAVAGHAPTNHTFTVQPANNELRYVLPAGRELRGRILDESGQPVSDARVYTGPSAHNTATIDWTGRSDSAGRFEWAEAPAYQESYIVRATGYEWQTNLALVADGTEQLVTLRRLGASLPSAMRFAGLVTDAQTGKLLDTFEVFTAQPRTYIGGSSRATNAPFEFGDLSLAATGSEGRYNFLLTGPLRRFVTEVRAEGYLPARMTNAGGSGASHTLNFALRPAVPIRGVVRSPTGQPISDATVVLAAQRAFLPLEEGGQLSLHNFKPQNGAFTHSTEQGEFRFNPHLAAQWLVAVHRTGFAELRLGEPRDAYTLELQPWGRIEGELRLGTNATAGLRVKLHSPQWVINPAHSVSPYQQTKTKTEGRFAFEFVPPGEHSISFVPDIPISVGLAPHSHTVRVAVQPGATAQVRLGGAGRTIVGRAVADGLGREVNWRQDVHRLTSIWEYPKEIASYPPSRDFDTREAWAAAVNQINARRSNYFNSPVGRDAQLRRREYVLLFQSDGSFRVDDVLPGTYDVYIGPRVTATNRYAMHGPVIGSVSKLVVVPEGGADSPTIDLGLLHLKASAKPTPAPKKD